MKNTLRNLYSKYLSVKIATVTIVVFLSIAVMMPLVKIAEIFGVNIKDHVGLNFKVSFGNIFFFFLFGICSIIIIWLAQKYIHKKKLEELGFKGRIWSSLLIGFIVGVILVGTKYIALILTAGHVSYTSVIPPDVSFFSYIGY